MPGRALAAGLALAAVATLAAADPLPCAPDRITLLGAQGPVTFDIELAVTPEEQARGLMYRPSLAPDAGMLFVYDPPQPASFWMKNTMIPLDMVFIDDAGQVANIAERTVPYSLSSHASDGAVRAVLEIGGGLSAVHGFEPGTQAIHPAFEAAPEAHRCPPAD